MSPDEEPLETVPPLAPETEKRRRRRVIATTAVAALALSGFAIAVWSQPEPDYSGLADDSGIAHGETGHDHDAMLALLREEAAENLEESGQAPPSADEEPTGDSAEKPAGDSAAGSGEGTVSDPSRPAPPPEPDDLLTISGCLKGYGQAGQCVPGSFPDKDGNPIPVTCDALADIFPKGIGAPETDPAGLDSNGDGTACGKGD